MNESQFRDLMARVESTFERVKSFMERGRADGSAVETMRSWFSIVADREAGSAMASISEIAKEEVQPRNADGYLRRIRERAAPERERRTYAGGEQTYRCPDCQDTGLVSVFLYGRILERRIAQELVGELVAHLESTAVACSRCERAPKEVERFNPGRMENWEYRKYYDRSKVVPA